MISVQPKKSTFLFLVCNMKSRVSEKSSFQEIGRSPEKSTFPKVQFRQCAARESSVKDAKKKSSFKESQKRKKRKKKQF